MKNILLMQLREAVLQIGTDILKIKKKLKIMGAELENIKAQNAALTTAITEQTTVIGSAVVLINGFGTILTELKQQLDDAIAANDPAALQEVANNLAANATIVNQTKQNLAEAVAATPVE